jgi:uncharacterized protein (TIGR03437 family)
LALAASASGQTTSILGGGGAPLSGGNGGFGAPVGVTTLSDGSSVYSTDTGVYRVSPGPDGKVTTLIKGDGSIGGVAVDGDGNFYYAVPQDNIVRINSGYLYAGTGVAGYNGDNIPARSALLNSPTAVAASGTRNGSRQVAIADTGNHCIRGTYIASYISENGITKAIYPEPDPEHDYISTLAGSCGHAGYSGDGGNSYQAMLNKPSGVAIGPNGAVYIADSGNGVIRMVTPDGKIVTLNGPQRSARGTGETPHASVPAKPFGVAVDTDGTVYYTDVNYSTVVKISNGVSTVVAGTSGRNGFSGDNGPASNATLNQPQGIAVDANHNLLIADTGNLRVRMISAATGIITTVFGNGSGTYGGDGSAAVNAQLYRPTYETMDAAGNLYIADSGNYVIRKVDTNGIITTVAGTGKKGTGGGDGGPATSSALSGPLCVAVAPDGSLLIGDNGNLKLRKVAANGTISTIPAPGAITAMLYDSSGNLLISSSFGMVYSMNAAGTVKTIAGGGTGGDGGPAATASLFSAAGIALDSAGNLFIAEPFAYDVRRVDAKTGIITTVAGIPNNYGFAGDGGPATKALLSEPLGVAVDSAGNLFIADTYNNAVRIVGTDGIIHTFAGGPGATYTGDGALTSVGALNTPFGITVDSSGNLYIADTGDSVIRKVTRGTGPAIGAVVNGAGATNSPAIAPAEVVTIYGANLGPPQLAIAAPDSTNKFPQAVAGMQVLFNGMPSPVYFTSAGQAAAFVPYGLTGPTATVQVSYQGQISPVAFTVPVDVTVPGIFTSNASGSGQAAALNTDSTVNSVSNPVHPNGVIVLYATGEGLTNPGGIDGLVSTGPVYAKPLQAVSVTIGGLPATLNYAGEAPFLVAGVLQINAVVPAGVQTGNAVPVTLQVGQNFAQSTVTIAIQ